MSIYGISMMKLYFNTWSFEIREEIWGAELKMADFFILMPFQGLVSVRLFMFLKVVSYAYILIKNT